MLRLAEPRDYSRMSREEFDILTGRLANRLAKKGIFFWPGLGRFLLSSIPLILYVPVSVGYSWLDW
jgi:ABC-type antimicrobial peptide transport system permease subunit